MAKRLYSKAAKACFKKKNKSILVWDLRHIQEGASVTCRRTSRNENSFVFYLFKDQSNFRKDFTVTIQSFQRPDTEMVSEVLLFFLNKP